jgi:hypothetical protein
MSVSSSSSAGGSGTGRCPPLRDAPQLVTATSRKLATTACAYVILAGYPERVEDTVRVRCPYCRDWIDLYVDPDTTGTFVEDCAVCCRPWTVTVERDAGRLRVQVSRAQ